MPAIDPGPAFDPEKLPPTFPVQTASRVLGIGKNKTYRLISAGQYPVRVLDVGGRFRVSRYDLLAYLRPGQPAQQAPAAAAGRAACSRLIERDGQPFAMLIETDHGSYLVPPIVIDPDLNVIEAMRCWPPCGKPG